MVRVFKNKVLLAPTTVPGWGGAYYRQGQAKDRLRVSGHCKEAGSYHSVVSNLKKTTTLLKFIRKARSQAKLLPLP